MQHRRALGAAAFSTRCSAACMNGAN